jgi:hypothetical protein
VRYWSFSGFCFSVFIEVGSHTAYPNYYDLIIDQDTLTISKIPYEKTQSWKNIIKLSKNIEGL